MWISVKVRLPEPDQRVDVWRRGTGRITDCVCHHRSVTNDSGTSLASWYQRYGGYAGGASITHWRPLPDPPSESGDLGHNADHSALAVAS